jgi:hypothetical protein
MRSSPRLGCHGAVLGATLLAALASPALARLDPVGGPLPLDRPPDCGSEDPSTTALGTGGFAAVWTDGGSLWWRRLDATGRPIGEPVEVGHGEPVEPEVVSLASGGFAVVWYDRTSQRVLVRAAGADLVLGGTVTADEVPPQPGFGFNGLDAAIAPSGDLVVVWAHGPFVLLREQRPDGSWVTEPSRVLASDTISVGPTAPALFEPAVHTGLDGASRVFAVDGYAFPYQDRGHLLGVRVGPLLPNGDPSSLNPIAVPATGVDHDPDVARAADGSYLLVWGGDPATQLPILPVPRPAVLAVRYTASDLLPDGPVFVEETAAGQGAPAVDAMPGGGYIVAWEVLSPGPRVRARRLDEEGTALDPPVALAPPQSWGQTAPDLAVGPGGLVVTAWQEVPDPDVVPVQCPGEQVQVRSFQAACPGGGTVCLAGGRFELALRYFDPRRGIAPANAAGSALTADAGYFWFSAPDNVEVVVKVLDGRALNGHFWVFYGGLTDLGFDLEVVDTLTGAKRKFSSTPGPMASRGVVDALPAGAAVEQRELSGARLIRDAFPASGEAPGLGVVGTSAGETAPASAVDSGAGPCAVPWLSGVPRPGLCLNAGRFEVEVDWRAFDGSTGAGQGVSLGDDSGYFWFFGPDNIELVVKVLDGRPVNGRFWVFHAALTNVEYALHVRHVLPDQAGADGTAEYGNPSGHFVSRGDIDALIPPGEDCACPSFYAPVCGMDGQDYESDCVAYCVGWVREAKKGFCH